MALLHKSRHHNFTFLSFHSSFLVSRCFVKVRYLDSDVTFTTVVVTFIVNVLTSNILETLLLLVAYCYWYFGDWYRPDRHHRHVNL